MAIKGCTKYQLDPSLLDTISLRKEKFQTYSQSKEEKSATNRKSPSLMSICTSKLKEPVCPQIITQNRSTYHSIQDTKKSKSLQVRSPVCTTIVKVHGSQVNSTLEAVNQYAEKVRMTMVKEHKIMQQFSSKQLKHSKAPSENITFAGFEGLQQIVAPINSRKAFLSNNFSASMAYKTINLLYKTLVGKHSSKRNNRFDLGVSKLPIVDRNSVKRAYHSHEKSQQSGTIYTIQAPQTLHNNQNQKHDKDQKEKEQRETDHNEKVHVNTKRQLAKLRLRKNPLNEEEIEIVPWATQQDLPY